MNCYSSINRHVLTGIQITASGFSAAVCHNQIIVSPAGINILICAVISYGAVALGKGAGNY